MGQRSTTKSRRGGALVDSYRYAKGKQPHRRSNRNGAVVTYKAGEPKPELPSPRNAKRTTQ